MEKKAPEGEKEVEKRVLDELGEAIESLMEQVRRIGYKDPVLGREAYKEVLRLSLIHISEPTRPY